MSGSSLRRTVLCILVVALLLPLASASAAPVRARDAAARIQAREWTDILLQPLSELLSLFRSASSNASMPPGHKPGNGDGDGDGPSRDGSGLDPHGKPGRG